MMINVAIAITGNGGIGLKGGLPWPHLKTDMALFSKRTTGAGNNAVLMGKNTWLSIPEGRRPLKNRTNIIVSSSLPASCCCHVVSSIYDALTHCEAAKYDELWIIGGSRIYNEFLHAHHDKVHRVYITYVCKNGDNDGDNDGDKDGDSYECDTFINIPHESYLIEEKVCNPTENCYYLTCVHKVHVNNGGEMDKLEDFIKGRSDENSFFQE
jgi:dihydrofolate reductase